MGAGGSAAPVGLGRGEMMAARLAALSLESEAADAGRTAAIAAATSGAVAAAGTATDRLVSIGAGFKSRKELMQYVELRTRPDSCDDKRGASGTPINLVTNFFKMTQWVNWTLFQYKVDFFPQVESRRDRKEIVSTQLKDQCFAGAAVFDGMLLFSPIRLEMPGRDPYTIDAADPSTRSKIRVSILLTNEIPPTSASCLQLYNIMLREILTQIDLFQVGRHYYNPNTPAIVSKHKLEIWPGYVTAINNFDAGLLLMAEVSHKVLRTDSVLDCLNETYKTCKSNDIFMTTMTKKLVGQIVLTRYNNKTYRVDDLAWGKTPKDTFKSDAAGGTEISYLDYFSRTYGRDIVDKDQPLLVSRPKVSKKEKEIYEKKFGKPMEEKEVHLIPELCSLTGLTDEARADFGIMKDVSAHTRVSPATRHERMLRFMQDIREKQVAQAQLNRWGLKFTPELLEVKARVLAPEKIFQQRELPPYKPAEAEWSREMRGVKMLNPIALRDWALVCTKRDAQTAQSFISTLGKVCPPMGMEFAQAKVLELNDDRTETFCNAIRSASQSSISIVVAVLPNNRKDRYDAIKKLCCADLPVPSQCVVTRTISKPQMLMSVATKIAVQMNAKMGGEVWAVDIPLKKCMVVGFDSHHDSSSKGQSIGGFVASMNRLLTRYYSRPTRQHTHMELADGLKTCMIAALKEWKEKNGDFPDRILFYRDGVSDGQLEAVSKYELGQLMSAYKAVDPDYDPRWACIIVKKQINQRFITKQGSNYANPPPGTIIDSDVTKPEWYDFFLVPQAVRQGAVTPTSFNVIWDNSGLKPDHIQKLTYKLTHLYYNWPGTIRVPAPCQYAHKLAFLVGQSVHKDPSLELANKLFYL